MSPFSAVGLHAEPNTISFPFSLAGGSVSNRVLVWQWGRRGAGPRFAAELASGMQAAGLEPVLSLTSTAEDSDRLSSLCRRLRPVAGANGNAGFVFRSMMLPETLRRLDRWLRREPIAAAVCAMPGYWDLPMAKLLAHRSIPLVTIVHDVKPHPGDGHRLVYQLQRSVIRASSAVVTLTDYVSGTLASVGRVPPITRLFHPPFAFADIGPPPASAITRIDSRPLRILVVGRMKTYKGIENALSMLGHLPSGAVRLRVAGAAEGGSWISRARCLSDVDVRLGWLSDRDLLTEIDLADLVLFPYTSATQSGLVPLCQSRGRPVVVTPVGGIAEQVCRGVDGLVAREANAEALACVVRSVVNSRAQLETMSRHALRLHAPMPSWEKFVDGLQMTLRVL